MIDLRTMLTALLGRLYRPRPQDRSPLRWLEAPELTIWSPLIPADLGVAPDPGAGQAVHLRGPRIACEAPPHLLPFPVRKPLPDVLKILPQIAFWREQLRAHWPMQIEGFTHV
jgi:hypothetical protein